jgi:hypothetical protein
VPKNILFITHPAPLSQERENTRKAPWATAHGQYLRATPGYGIKSLYYGENTTISPYRNAQIFRPQKIEAVPVDKLSFKINLLETDFLFQ